MHILEMSPEIATLSEGFLAEWTFEGTQAGMLPEVVSQVAALLKDTPTVRVTALEIKLYSLSFRVLNSYCLVALFRDSFKSFVLTSA
jgi:hypothetical protein